MLPLVANLARFLIVKTSLDENKLTLNVKKTKSMLIGNKKLLNEAVPLDIRLDMDSIEQVWEFKFLGIVH